MFFENDLMRVGPESSGASPGPVCYGNCGYLSITDANLVLGILNIYIIIMSDLTTTETYIRLK